MALPQQNAFRQTLDLSGLWSFRFDPDERGTFDGWQRGVPDPVPIAVPSSWNELFVGWRDYLDAAWYETRFDLPWGWDGQEISIRFGSVNYFASVYLNGIHLGDHEGGHLPFVFDIGDHVVASGNTLIVRVEGRLSADRIPPIRPSSTTPAPFEGDLFTAKPNGGYDFFPYCGIQRSVVLFTRPAGHIDEVFAIPDIDGTNGVLTVDVSASVGHGKVHVILEGHGAHIKEHTFLQGGAATAVIRVPDAALWHPDHPNLYRLVVRLEIEGTVRDEYSLEVGIRTVRVEGSQLLLNGEPIVLRGYGRHEDFPVIGRGFSAPVMVKDFELMKWTGANSFRTTHYPYAEEQMIMADRLGFLVIDETPIVGLHFESGYDTRLALSRSYVEDMVRRDRNHPSVIMWSLANEPRSAHPRAPEFFRDLYDLCRSLDESRPVTLVSMRLPQEEVSFDFLDVVCINRYFGWYSEQGDLEKAESQLSAFLDEIYDRFKKPVIVSEFGADTVAGHHAVEPEMFSEEYQAEFISRYIAVMDAKNYVAGQHVWNLCDFKTSQSIRRVNGQNLKGVFTRDRNPKLAAHRLRELWANRQAR